MHNTRWLYLASIACFAAAMLSKGSVAMLPGILLVLAWWRRGGIHWRDVGRVFPFALIAAGLTLVNIWFQARHVSTAVRDVSLLQRALGAGAVVWFYLFKALLPIKLIFVYPPSDIRADDVRWWLPSSVAMAVSLWLWWKRHTPAGRSLLFAWTMFCVALVPVMGLTDAYYMRYSLVADRYSYIALLPVLAAACAGLAWLAMAGRPADAGTSVRKWLLSAACAALALALGVSTWKRSHVYKDADTLWTATLQQNPKWWLCETNQAAVHLREALRLDPSFADARTNLDEITARRRTK